MQTYVESEVTDQLYLLCRDNNFLILKSFNHKNGAFNANNILNFNSEPSEVVSEVAAVWDEIND